MGRILDADDRNNRLGLNDLKAMDPRRSNYYLKHPKMYKKQWEVGKVIKAIRKIN